MAFTLATFNTYWLFDSSAPLERWGVNLPPGGLEEKITRVATAIRSVGSNGPDIIALQEVEGPVVLEPLTKRLAEMGTAYPHWWSSEVLDPYTGQNVAVLSKHPATTVPVRRLDQITIDYIDHRERLRAGSLGKFLRVDIQVDGDVLSLFVVHLKSRRGGTEETRLLRNAQAQIVRRLSLPRIEQGNSRSPSFTAIVGDFNDEPQTSPLDFMQGKRDTSYNLQSATENMAPEDKWTYVYRGEEQQLDHILLSKFLNDRLKSAGITRVDDETSDHDLVWAELDISS